MVRIFVNILCSLLLWCFSISASFAAECLDVFPAGLTGNVLNGDVLINVPSNNSGVYINNGTVVNRGNNFYLGSNVGIGGVISVANQVGAETTARVYIRTPVSWNNVKINTDGEASDLIIVVSGSVSISGDDTEINAIIYATGAVDLSGEIEFSGAVTAEGSVVNYGDAIVYDDEAISQADFNGMCGNQPVIPISCVDNLPDLAFSDDFSINNNDWQTTDFDRAISVWPGDAIYSSSNEIQLVQFDIGSGRLAINGAVSNGGDNEFGMVNVNQARAAITTEFVDNYAISADITADKTGLNNDIGFVFGFIDSSNFYIARWTKYGQSYNNNNAFPGDYRRFELVKVSAGVATSIDAIDNFDVDDPFNLKVVVNNQGTAVCVNNSAKLYSASEQPNLANFGVYSYDNDDGAFVDNFVLNCNNCTLAKVLANYQFDECELTGVNNDVLDQTGRYLGSSKQGVDTGNDGQIARALDLSDHRHHVQVNVPLNREFSVSTWFKKPTSTRNSRYFVLGALANGGDLLFLDRNRNWRWGVYSANPRRISNGTFEFGSLDNAWHHLVLVYSTTETRLYIDGQFIESVPLTITGSLRYIGASYDRVNTNNSQGFRGALDEFIVFDDAMTANQVNDIYSNQLTKRNYDGSTRTMETCPQLLALYRFEQNDFANGIDDSSGNANHGSNIGGSSVDFGRYCRAFDSNGVNQSSDTYNAFNSNLDLNSDVGDVGSISFWFKSNTDWNEGGFNGNGERTLFDASLTSSNYYFTLEIIANGQLRFAFEDSTDADFRFDSSMPVGKANVWYYVTATWSYQTNQFQLYLNGALVGSATPNTNNILGDLGSLIFGDNAASYGQNNNASLASYTSANGRFDEVRVYNKVLTPSEIITDMNESFGCASFDHFEIVHDGLGLTCEPEVVQINACADANCTGLVGDTYDVTLTIAGSNNSSQSVSVTGSAQANVSVPIASTVSLGLVEGATCVIGSSRSCELTFANAGFKFSAGTLGNPIINAQESGANFNQDIFIQALEDNGTGVCQSIFNGSQEVNLAMKYQTPDKPTVNQYQVGGQAIVKNLSLATPLNYSAVNLNFINYSGELAAKLPVNRYFDVGQIQLLANYKDNSSGLELTGNSNGFWVYPSYLQLSISNQLDPHIAGAPFDIRISAKNNTNGTTTNYEPQSFAAKATRIAPVPAGNDGRFSFTASSSLLATPSPLNFTPVNNLPFVDGEFTTSVAQYSEVGEVALDVQDSNYAGQLISSQTMQLLNRFTPAYFVVSDINEGQLTGQCSSDPTFAYFGEKQEINQSLGAISYAVEPYITLTPYNHNNEVVDNYIDEFMRFSAVQNRVTIIGPSQDNSALGKDATPLNVDSVLSLGSFELGAGTDIGKVYYRLNSNDHFTYQRSSNTLVQPFTAALEFNVAQLVDQDGIQTVSKDEAGGNIPLLEKFTPTGINILYGRTTIQNTFGPETEPLAQKFTIEYFDNNNWLTHATNSCTSFSSTKVTVAPSLAVTNILTGQFTSGEFADLSISAPGAGNVGAHIISYETLPWLIFDWDDNGIEENPSATAQFGRFRGNDRIIFWREVNR